MGGCWSALLGQQQRLQRLVESRLVILESRLEDQVRRIGVSVEQLHRRIATLEEARWIEQREVRGLRLPVSWQQRYCDILAIQHSRTLIGQRELCERLGIAVIDDQQLSEDEPEDEFIGGPVAWFGASIAAVRLTSSC